MAEDKRSDHKSQSGIRCLPIISKLNNGAFDDCTLMEVKDLFTALDANANGKLDRKEMDNFLRAVMDPLPSEEAMDELCLLEQETAGDSFGPEAFYSAVTAGPLRRLLFDQHRQEVVHERQKKEEQGVVTRSFLLDRLSWRTERDDCFVTLPFSFVYMTIFILLVVLHLRTWERAQIEKVMEEHMEGWGFNYVGPYMEEHLPNIDNYYIWLETSGFQSAFYYCAPHALKSVAPHQCEVAPRNALLGDVLMKQERLDGSLHEVWVLNSEVAQNYLNQSTSEDRVHEAALAQLAHLRETHWIGRETLSVDLILATYNEDPRMFTLAYVRSRFTQWGYPKHSRYVYSVPAQAYGGNVGLYVLDGAFLVLMLYPAIGELKEVSSIIKLRGTRGLKEYVGFWNGVDWFAVFAGLWLVGVWSLACSLISDDILQNCLTEDYALKPSVMNLSVDALAILQAHLGATSQVLLIINWSMCLNTGAILLKFFKGFQANARLQVAAQTLINAASDLFHFMVVFSAVYNLYVITGHLLFSGDIVQFNSYMASFNTCFLCLMGDFGWYSELSERSKPLASGLPWLVPSLWFFSFMIFTLLILLNMLLAIIMSSYDGCMSDMRGMPDAPALWQQTSRFLKRRKKARQCGFTPLEAFIAQLTDDAEPAHPDEVVTEESLQRYLTGMNQEQAQFIMAWLQKDSNALASKHAGDPTEKRLKEVIAFCRTLAEIFHITTLSVLRCETWLANPDLDSSGGPPPSRPDRHDPQALQATLPATFFDQAPADPETISEQVSRMEDATKSLQVEAAFLSKSIQELLDRPVVVRQPFEPIVRDKRQGQTIQCCSIGRF